jgi:hypothetical protein
MAKTPSVTANRTTLLIIRPSLWLQSLGVWVAEAGIAFESEIGSVVNAAVVGFHEIHDDPSTIVAPNSHSCANSKVFTG